MGITDHLLNTQQAAKLIGVTDSNVRKMLREGRLKGYKLSERAWAIPRREAIKCRDNPATTGRPRSGA